jgi:hypothetical protein
MAGDRGDVTLLKRNAGHQTARPKKSFGSIRYWRARTMSRCAKGLQAALPYLDMFLSVHNVNSLVSLGRTFRRWWRDRIDKRSGKR